MQPPCPICASPFTAYVRDVPTRRTKRNIKLFTCLDCRSFWNPSGYREDEEQLKRDLAWGLSVVDRNKVAAKRLFKEIQDAGVRFRSVAEIGCGIGTLMTVARDMGKTAIGYDVNPVAIEYAKTTNKVDAHAEFWSSDTPMPKVDLYLCISVLEHIDEPRPLVENLCRAALRDKAALFVSVPTVDRDRWHHILDPDPYKPGTQFFDNDVHVTHFSTDGLLAVMREFGMKQVIPFGSNLWQGALATP